MKTIFIIIFSFFVLSGNAKKYYISNSGDDKNIGTSINTPWLSLNKVNGTIFQPGDSILFKCGDSFNGSLNITVSGTVNDPIMYASYGSGRKPIINGLAILSGWTKQGDIYESSLSAGATLSMVTIDGIVKAMGRFPNMSASNKGYLTLDSHESTVSITDASLPASPNWSGAEVVIRKFDWVLDRCLITRHSGKVLSYTSPTGHQPNDGNGYFIQNSPLTLDIFGEWYYNPAQNKLMMYFGSKNPNSYHVKASVTDRLVVINGKSNIIFENLSFHGADEEAFKLQSSVNIVIKNCDVEFSGTEGITGSNSGHVSIENSSFSNTNNDAIKLTDCSHTIIRSNTIKNSGLLPGMGLSNNQQYLGIFVKGTGNLVEYNKVDSTGYSAITFSGDSAIIRYNFINYFCLTVNDGAGIYTWGDYDKKGRKVIGNIVLNGIGAPEGTNSTIPGGAIGIYTDDRSANVEMLNNTVANCSRAGILLHNSHEMTIKRNTLFNNGVQLSMLHDDLEPADPIRNVVVTSNILFSKKTDQFILEKGSSTNDIARFGSFDSNYHARPVDENAMIYTNYKNASKENISEVYDLDQWKKKYGYDRNSKKSPVKISSFSVKSIGSNTYKNGQFNTNINDVFCLGNCTVSWVNNGKLDGGTLETSAKSSTTKNIAIYLNIGAVSRGTNYLIKFSLLGSNSGKTVKVFIIKNGAPYNALSDMKYFKVSTTRTENELLFSPFNNEPNTLLVFELEEQGYPLWLDNIQIHQNVSLTNLDDLIRFEYNATKSPRTISLTGKYIDVKNNKYSGAVKILPYQSIILIKQ